MTFFSLIFSFLLIFFTFVLIVWNNWPIDENGKRIKLDKFIKFLNSFPEAPLEHKQKSIQIIMLVLGLVALLALVLSHLVFDDLLLSMIMI